MENLLMEIEQKRYDMLIAARKHGLKSEETIQLSQELDELLNRYNLALQNFNYVHESAM